MLTVRGGRRLVPVRAAPFTFFEDLTIHVKFQNLEKWINESTHGVIYFSMGSMIKGHTFPTEKRDIFLRAFGRLKQRVLWKWETDTMPGKPDNLMIQKWMPQLDILCKFDLRLRTALRLIEGGSEADLTSPTILYLPLSRPDKLLL